MPPPKPSEKRDRISPLVSNHQLFSGDFLERRFPTLPEVQGGRSQDLFTKVRAIYENAGPLVESGTESAIETNLVNPILDLVNPYYLTKEPLRTRLIPDYVFFPDAPSKQSRNLSTVISVADAKEPGKDFDRAQGTPRSPTRQVYDYLVDTQSHWGFVTDGSRWRLIHRDSPADHYLEVDLREVARLGDEGAWLRFYFLFRREAFLLLRDGSFLDRLKNLSDHHAHEISEELKERVYQALLELASGLVSRPSNNLDAGDHATREALRQSCFVLLYRLLFVFYSEARGLLPVDKEEYKRHSLRRIREKARDIALHRTLQIEGECGLWKSLSELFRIINEGDPRLGVTAYNGGLFASEPQGAGLLGFGLEGLEIGDESLARAIELLGSLESSDSPTEATEVDYSRLEIRHLGSIYEGLLEYRLAFAAEELVSRNIEGEERWVRAKTADRESTDHPSARVPAGALYLETERGERKTSGSYYTPESVVKYIVRATLKPLVDRRLSDAVSKGTSQVDSLLGLKVCDPAMGSGHFLVEATEFLADALLAAAETDPEKAGGPDQTSLAWAKREVLRHCIYGVDLNPLAVELAKVSLWLTTVDPDKPLSFLDNRLKCGDSLVGVALKDMAWPPGKRPANIAAPLEVPRKLVDKLLSHVTGLEASEENTVRDVKNKESAFHAFLESDARRRFKALGDIHVGLYFSPHDEREVKAQYVGIATEVIFGSSGAREKAEGTPWAREAQLAADSRRVFHWNVEFPEATLDTQRGKAPGFDAVVGNPPYVRAERQDKLERLYIQESPSFTHVTGRFDLSIPFIEASFRLLRPDGRFGMILPDSVLTTNYAKQIRQWVLNELSLDTVVDFDGLQVFGPKVGIRNCILIVQKSTPAENWSIEFSTPHDLSTLTKDGRRLPRQMFLTSKDAALRSGLNEASLAIKERMDRESIPLSQICYCITGVVAHDPKTGASKNRLISTKPVDKWSLPYIEAKEWSGRYGWIEPKRFIEYRPTVPGHMHRVKFPELFSSPKILIAGISSGGLIATLDTQGIVCNHSLNCCVKLEDVWHLGRKRLHLGETDVEGAKPDPRYQLHYVLALMSSRLVGWYFAEFLGSKKGVMPKTAGQIPIRVIDFGTPTGKDLAPQLEKLRESVGESESFAAVIEQLPKRVRSRILHDFLADSARRMIDTNREIQAERKGFLEWLRTELRVDPEGLAGSSSVSEYEELTIEALIDILKRNHGRFPDGVHPDARVFQDRLRVEFESSRAKLLPLKDQNRKLDAAVDQAVFALYGTSEAEISGATTRAA